MQKINAMDDNVTPVSDLFQMAGILKAENLPAEIHIFPGGGHGFDLGNQDCNCLVCGASKYHYP
jgi:hypothetical protein